MFMFALPADAACKRPTEPQLILVIWRTENTVEVFLINRASSEDSPISFVVNIDGAKTQTFGPYDIRYGSKAQFKLEGLPPSAHIFTFQSVSGRTGCVSEETKAEKLESWYEHAHRRPIDDILPPFDNWNPPPN
jgi:hypothetical protein